MPDDDTQNSVTGRPTDQKLPYERPQLLQFGSLHDITLAQGQGIGGTAHLVMVTTVDAERPGTAPITKLSHLVVLGTPISGIEKIFMSLDARIARAGRLHGWEQRTSW